MGIINIIEIEDFRKELVRNNYFSVEYLFLEAGKSLPSETKQAMAIIEIIKGRITFVSENDGKNRMMIENTMLEFDARFPFSIIAHEDSRILMTIVPVVK